MTTFVFTRLATREIASPNLLLKADGTDFADLCGVGDNPIGVSTHSCGVNHVQTVRALDAKIFTLTASGPISFGADVGLAVGGKVAVWSSGAKLGRAVSEASEDGDAISVAVAPSAPSGGAGGDAASVTVVAAAPTADPGVASGTSAFCIHYDTAFRGFYFWNGTSWEQMV